MYPPMYARIFSLFSEFDIHSRSMPRSSLPSVSVASKSFAIGDLFFDHYIITQICQQFHVYIHLFFYKNVITLIMFNLITALGIKSTY